MDAVHISIYVLSEREQLLLTIPILYSFVLPTYLDMSDLRRRTSSLRTLHQPKKPTSPTPPENLIATADTYCPPCSDSVRKMPEPAHRSESETSQEAEWKSAWKVAFTGFAAILTLLAIISATILTIYSKSGIMTFQGQVVKWKILLFTL